MARARREESSLGKHSCPSVEQACELAPKNHLFGWGIEAILPLSWSLESPNPFATFLSIRSLRRSRL